jgi:hypothetical protein
VFDGPAYRWADTPYLIRLWREWWSEVQQWLAALQADNPAAFRLLVFALLIALLLLLAHGAWVVWRTIQNASAPADRVAPAAEVESHDAAWYFREADRAAAAGRLSAALQLGFVGLALTLDAEGLLRYHPSKTPAECAREARLVPEDGERLRALVGVLYGHVFGGDVFGPDDYRRWRAAVAERWHAAAY